MLLPLYRIHGIFFFRYFVVEVRAFEEFFFCHLQIRKDFIQLQLQLHLMLRLPFELSIGNKTERTNSQAGTHTHSTDHCNFSALFVFAILFIFCLHQKTVAIYMNYNSIRSLTIHNFHIFIFQICVLVFVQIVAEI